MSENVHSSTILYEIFKNYWRNLKKTQFKFSFKNVTPEIKVDTTLFLPYGPVEAQCLERT